MKLARGSFSNPDAEVLLKWPKVAKRVAYLIQNDNYLKPADYSRMPDYEQEVMAGRVVSFYHHLPEHIMRPWEGNPDMFTHRDDVVSLLRNHDGQDGLLRHMDEAIAELPLDFPDYEKRFRFSQICMGMWKGHTPSFQKRKKKKYRLKMVDSCLYLILWFRKKQRRRRKKQQKNR